MKQALFSKESAKTDTVRLILFVILFTLVGIFIPVKDFLWLFNRADDAFLNMILMAVVRFVFSAVFIFWSCRLGFKIFSKPTRGSLLVLIPALIVAINNFPFITFASAQAQIEGDAYQIFATVLFCVGVGFFEELSFRGIVLPLVLIKLSGKKLAVVFSVIASSAMFGLIHLVNLTAGFNAVVFLQVGYSFLIGAMCAIVYLKTKNIIFSIAIHSIYNICGKLCSGVYWTTASITLTAIVSLVVVIIMILFLINLQKDADKNTKV